MQRGRAYYAQQDYQRANLEFRNAMQIAPRDVNARLMAGHSFEKLDKLREAAGLYQSVLDAAPRNAEAMASLGRIYALAGLPDRAQKTIEPGLATHPDDAGLLGVRAMARLEQKDAEGAAADADHALRLNRDDEDLIGLRAGLYQRAGDSAGALALVTEALKRSPRSIALHEVLAELYANTKQLGVADAELRQLIALKPAELRYRKQLALFYVRQQRVADAQQVLEVAVKELPKSNEAKLELVSFVGAQRTPADAEKTLRTFIAREPKDYALRFGLAELQQREGDTAGALATYQEIVQRAGKDPNRMQARDRIAAIYLAQGKASEARALVDEVLRDNGRDNDALLVRSELALQRKETLAAIADLRALVQDRPSAVPLQRLLARAYAENHDEVLAEQTLRAALDIAPDDLALRIQLADLLLKGNRAAPAVTLLEETVRRDPTNVQAREALVSAYLATRDYEAALRSAEDLKTLQPNEATGPYLAGRADLALNKLDEAQHEFERAHELQPRAFEPLSALAQLEFSRGQKAQGISLAEGAVKDTGGHDGALLNLEGELYLANKDQEKARDAFAQAIAAAPKWWPPYRNLALVHLAGNDVAAALDEYGKAEKIAPQEVRLVVESAQLYEAHARVGEAVDAYEEFLKRNPGSEVAANNLAMLLVTYRNDAASLDRARDLTAPFANATSASLLDTNGWVHIKRGEYAGALPVLEKAAQLVPASNEIRYHLAVAQLHAGQPEQGRANLKTALAGAGSARWGADARATFAGLPDHHAG
ncbi:MAG: tetratricopeptide repeat protein [Gammaproteobacteria bacterium]|nr:tetratricopeptide repeat protein [Gammaproteobacteria bacterium]MBV9696920.1 tetratricopeptide repeat protein [Gammaproteobacteria bacterium]